MFVSLYHLECEEEHTSDDDASPHHEYTQEERTLGIDDEHVGTFERAESHQWHDGHGIL